MSLYQHYKKENFRQVNRLSQGKRRRVLSSIVFDDLKRMVKEPGATVHICPYCNSAGFQLYEVKPPRSRRVSKKLVVNCLKCGQWFNLDSYSFG